MGKNMALIDENGVVVNFEWVSSETEETETLKDMPDLVLELGDTYLDGQFYRDGIKILTPLEESRKRIAELEAIDADKTEALAILGVTL